MPKPKRYCKKTLRKHAAILAMHLRRSRDKPLVASVKTRSNSVDAKTSPWFNNLDLVSGRKAPASYRASSQPVRPMNTGTVSRNARETLRLVMRKAKS